MIGKPDESLGRKAIGPVKWQPVAWNEVHCLWDGVFFMILFGYEQVAKRIANIRLTDSGGVGLDAAKEFFGQLKTLSEADAEWK